MQFSTGILIVLSLCLPFEGGFGEGAQGARDYANAGNTIGGPHYEPGPPVNVRVSVVSPTALEVTWEPAADSSPEFFRVKWHGSGIPPGDEIVHEMSFLIDGLLACTNYFITITASYDGVEYPTGPVEETTDSEAPPMPTNCTVDKETSNMVSIKWTHPLTNCPVYNYNVSWLWAALWNENFTDEGSDTSGEMSFTVRGIKPYSEVLISIQGKTASGYGPAVDCEAQTEEYFPSSPKLVSVSEGADFLSVTWAPPEEPNGIILSYRVTRISDTGENAVETDGDTLTTKLYGVVACQNYTVTVAASTSKGFGNESNQWEIYVTGEAPLETVKCSGEASRNFSVTWDHGSVTCKDQNYHITWNYTVLWSDDKGQGSEKVPGNETTYNFLDALPHTQYTVCVAITKDTDGSVCCVHETAEDAPSQPTIKDISSFRGDARISWSPPEEANGIVRNYNVSWESATAPSGIQTFDDVSEGVVKGPEACHTYAFSVTAGTTVWGNRSESRDLDVVNYVDILTCSSGGIDVIHALYTFATADCDYRLRNTNWKVNVLWNNNTWADSETNEHSTAAGSFTLDSLEPYSQVEVCMSVPGRKDEEACCSAITEEDVPDKPSEVSVSNVTNTTARISWTRPLHVNGDIKSWQVSLRKSSENEVTNQDVEKQFMYFVAEDLTPSTSYQVEVKCLTGGGLSEGQRSSFKTLNPDNSSDNPPNLGLIIGVSVGAGVLLVVLGAGLAFYLRKRRKAVRAVPEKDPPYLANNNSSVVNKVHENGGYEEDHL